MKLYLRQFNGRQEGESRGLERNFFFFIDFWDGKEKPTLSQRQKKKKRNGYLRAGKIKTEIKEKKNGKRKKS